jgi:hypothetical protein
MAPDCLEKLVAALEAHPECDIAHCRLKAIDSAGIEIPGPSWRTSIFANSCGPLLDCLHVRKAPFDGLLHLLGGSVYISITQLLIRRSLFDRIGLFESTWGSVGDFHWSMRAGLSANIVHVPDTWGGWRIHDTQATAGAEIGSMEHTRKIEEMIADVLSISGKSLTPPLSHCLATQWAPAAHECRAFLHEVEHRDRSSDRRAFIVRRFLCGSPAARQHVRLWLTGHKPWSDLFPNLVQTWLNEVGFGPTLVPDGSRALESHAQISDGSRI